MVKKYYTAFICLLVFIGSINAQHSFTFEKQASVNLMELSEDLFPQLIYHQTSDEFSSEKTGYLESVKEQVSERYPRKYGISPNRLRGAGPQIVQSIQGIPGSLGIPLDNHLAVSNDGNVIAVANFHLTTYNENGELQAAVSLIKLTQDLRLPDFRYDPRVIYDAAQDRFILTMLHSSNKDRTLIIVGFSETNDPSEDWNFYTIEGNPFDINIFSDYPMLAITNDNFYFTVNAVDVDKTWQEGFVETYIWEIGKAEGYAGSTLDATMYNDIIYNNRNIRNLCPISSADGTLMDKQYFLSNRNFDVENDTLFLVTLDDGNIDIRHLITDVPYGVPPNAVQTSQLSLQTNDARVLDAFFKDNHVQFVSNTVNPINGFATIYHGLIEDIETSTTITGNVLAYGDLELGYPDISWAGIEADDRHAIIVTSHVGEGRFPGISALEYDGNTHSDLVSLVEGADVINQIGGEVQRWGDYAGNDRRLNRPGTCWTVASYGRGQREYGVWINELARSDVSVSVVDPEPIQLDIWPNPTTEWLQIAFNIVDSGPISIDLYDLNGRKIKSIVDTKPKKQGAATFKFTMDQMPAGTYVVRAVQNEIQLFSETIIVE